MVSADVSPSWKTMSPALPVTMYVETSLPVGSPDSVLAIVPALPALLYQRHGGILGPP
jgi:hypothetical protein